MSTCASCRHWRPVTEERTPGFEKFRQCMRIDANTVGYGFPGPRAAPAVIDLYDDPHVVARLITRPDFGCTLWEVRE